MNGSKPMVKTTGPYIFDQKHRREVTQFLKLIITLKFRSCQMRMALLSSITLNHFISMNTNHARSAIYTIEYGCQT